MRLLASLDIGSAVTTEVIVVDGGSHDDTAQAVHEDFPNVRVVRIPDNRGWSAAANVGFAKAAGDVVAFCHADVVTTVHDIGELADRIREGESKRLVAAVPRVVDAGGDELPTLGAMPGIGTATLGVFNPRAGRRLTEPTLDHVPDHQWTVMPCIAFSADVLSKLGGFEERFFLYYADTDLCARLHEKSYRIGIRRDVVAKHLGGETSADPLPPHLARIMRKDQQKYFEKHQPGVDKGVLKPATKILGWLNKDAI